MCVAWRACWIFLSLNSLVYVFCCHCSTRTHVGTLHTYQQVISVFGIMITRSGRHGIVMLMPQKRNYIFTKKHAYLYGMIWIIFTMISKYNNISNLNGNMEKLHKHIKSQNILFNEYTLSIYTLVLSQKELPNNIQTHART